jgi:indolepyruvate ferredoxin oxidoreductase
VGRFGVWLLARARGLRGSPLDPFGFAHVRRVERRLPGEYMALVDKALETLSPQTAWLVVEIAELPEMVRGYEEIKLAAVARFQKRAAELSRRLESSGGSAKIVNGSG